MKLARLFPILALVSLAHGQELEAIVSLNHHGPSIGALDSERRVPMTEADLLAAPGGTLAFQPETGPGIFRSGGDLGLVRYAQCLGHPGGTSCGIEVDAFSDGRSSLPRPIRLPYSINFSVDEHSVGLPTPDVPSLTSEAPAGESCGDIFVCGLEEPGPLGLPAQLDVPNIATADGDGIPWAAHANVGFGLVEPNPSHGTPPPDDGDDIDALDLAVQPGLGVAYFSLDGGLFDSIQNWQPVDSAHLQGGFSGAAVLRSDLDGSLPELYASATSLGLVPGDDLDALALRENGTPDFQPSVALYDWLPSAGNPRDLLLFSLRRGSPTLGTRDTLQDIAIEPGDILTPHAGGVGVFIRAENLGLATQRSGLVSDELDAIDFVRNKDIHDWNNNGVPDEREIAKGLLPDDNKDGIADFCQQTYEMYCLCELQAPCGNEHPGGGCINGTGVGALLEATGQTGIFRDDLDFHAEGLPPLQFATLFMGGAPGQVSFGNGQRCVFPGNAGTFRFPPLVSSPQGTLTLPSVAGQAAGTFPGAGILPGSTWYFQVWYRDPQGPCSGFFNFSSALEVLFGL